MPCPRNRMRSATTITDYHVSSAVLHPARTSFSLPFASSVFAVVAGASAQYFTGVLLEANGRDFSPIFLLTGGVELLGVVAFCSWWSSERAFE